MEDRFDYHGADEATTDPESAARREFLKKVGKTAATATSVAVLLAASGKPAEANSVGEYGGGCGCGS